MLAVLVLGLELEQVQERGQPVLDQLVLQALAQLGLILEREQELGQLVLQALAQQLVCHLTLRE